MALYTKNYLRNLANQFSQTYEFGRMVENTKGFSSFDIFLSHSYKDKEFIKGLFYELTKAGFKVYVDWIIDPHFDRKNVTEKTVNAIRKRLKQSKSLVYATSANASNSKWMPWELGFLDGNKGNCAILPITDYETDSFEGQEFLSAYPQIQKDRLSGVSKSNFKVQKGRFTSEPMSQWIL